MLDSLIPSVGVYHHCVIFTCPLHKLRLLPTGMQFVVIFREAIERQRSGGWVVAGSCEEGEGKELELPDLYKVNLPAICSVFRIEGNTLKSQSEKASFFIQNHSQIKELIIIYLLKLDQLKRTTTQTDRSSFRKCTRISSLYSRLMR